LIEQVAEQYGRVFVAGGVLVGQIVGDGGERGGFSGQAGEGNGKI
jgi:hypothetical protein